MAGGCQDYLQVKDRGSERKVEMWEERLKEAISPSDFLVSALHCKKKLLSPGLLSPVVWRTVNSEDKDHSSHRRKKVAALLCRASGKSWMLKTLDGLGRELPLTSLQLKALIWGIWGGGIVWGPQRLEYLINFSKCRIPYHLPFFLKKIIQK